MKEIFQSKVMIAFIVFVLGVIYFDAKSSTDLEKQKDLHQIENNASQVISQ